MRIKIVMAAHMFALLLARPGTASAQITSAAFAAQTPADAPWLSNTVYQIMNLDPNSFHSVSASLFVLAQPFNFDYPASVTFYGFNTVYTGGAQSCTMRGTNLTTGARISATNGVSGTGFFSYTVNLNLARNIPWAVSVECMLPRCGASGGVCQDASVLYGASDS